MGGHHAGAPCSGPQHAPPTQHTLLGSQNTEEVRTVFGNASTPSHCPSCVMSVRVCVCVFSHTPCFCTQYVRNFMMPNLEHILCYSKQEHFCQEAHGCLGPWVLPLRPATNLVQPNWRVCKASRASLVIGTDMFMAENVCAGDTCEQSGSITRAALGVSKGGVC